MNLELSVIQFYWLVKLTHAHCAVVYLKKQC